MDTQPETQRLPKPPRHPFGWPKHGSYTLWASTVARRHHIMPDITGPSYMILAAALEHIGTSDRFEIHHQLVEEVASCLGHLASRFRLHDCLRFFDDLSESESDEITLRVCELRPWLLIHLLQKIPAHADPARLRAIVQRLPANNILPFAYRGGSWKRTVQSATHFDLWRDNPQDVPPPPPEIMQGIIGCCANHLESMLLQHLPIRALLPLISGYAGGVSPCQVQHDSVLCGFQNAVGHALRQSEVCRTATRSPLSPLIRTAWAFTYGFDSLVADCPDGDDDGDCDSVRTSTTSTAASSSVVVSATTSPSSSSSASPIGYPPTPVRATRKRKHTPVDAIETAKRLLSSSEPLDFQCIDYIRRRLPRDSGWAEWREWWINDREWTFADYEYMLHPSVGCERLFRKVCNDGRVPLGNLIHIAKDMDRSNPTGDLALAFCIDSGSDGTDLFLAKLYDRRMYKTLEAFVRRVIAPRVRAYEQNEGVELVPTWWRKLSLSVQDMLLDILLGGPKQFPGVIGLVHGIRHHGLYEALIERMKQGGDNESAKKETATTADQSCKAVMEST